MSASSGASDDLEDGEIFDDDEPVEVFKGGGVDEAKASTPADSSPKEPVFKNKGNSGGADRKKPSNKDKRSSSSERRDSKRSDRTNNRSNAAGGGKRKRGRDSEDDHRNPIKPKQRKINEKNKGNQPLEEEVDENEMIYVMGGNSPPASKPMDWDMFSDDEDGDRERDGERAGGGRGRRGREGFHSSSRMSRRARLGRGGAKRNRFSRKQNNDLAICKFFLQGKCQRGNDCPFSHTALPSKKMELCKFYMSDRCTKKDKCMYMHRDFPCKFYHTGQKCYAGKRCKFYHGKISNFLRSVLMKHLENRELQNEFDKYREQYEKKDRMRNRDRFSDRRLSRSDEEEGGSTPMPSPQRDDFTSERERSLTPDREREKRERRRRRKQRRSREEEDNNREYHDDEGRQENDYYDDEGRQEKDYDCWQEGGDQLYNYGGEEGYNDNPDYTQDDYPEEEEQEDQIPVNLPKTQRKLFMRIQQQNKKSDERHREDEPREDDFKEENWYSSDEENANNNPLNTIFQNVPGLSSMQPPIPLMNAPIQPPMMQPPPPPMMNSQCPPMNQPPMSIMGNMMPQSSQPMVNMPNMFDNIDLSAVTKILTTVRESIQKKNHEPGGMGGPMGGPGGGPMGGPGGPMGGPGGPMGGPGGPMGGPGGPMGGPMGGPGGPMGGPGGPMGGPGGPMGGPMVGPGGPMVGPGGPMGGPGGPMGGPGGPMIGPMGGPGRPMEGPSGPMSSPGGPMNSPTGARSRAQESPSSSPKHNPPPAQEERRFRDPRLRTQDSSGSSSSNDRKASALSKPPLPTPVLLTQADLDLRLSEPPPHHSADASDVDLRRLPFKPAPLHQAANEIDASISSGPPIDYKMTSLKPIKPDYAAIATRSNPQTCANDPRLRKYATPQVLAQSQMVVAQALPSGGPARMMSPPQPPPHPMSPPHSQPSQPTRTEEVVSRDPRNRGGVANDPRRRNMPAASNPPQQQAFGLQAFSSVRPPQPFNPTFNSPQPFVDQQSLHQDNDFRLGLLPPQLPQQPSFVIPNMSDIDLRVQQPRYYQ